MIRFFQWVRSNSQKYLLEAAQADLASRYLGRAGPDSPAGPQVFFWKRLFVPLYRRLPWETRRAIILAMPGSHRQGWPDHSRSPARHARSGGAPSSLK
ncbi:MAG: hypothetical protein ACRDNZ_15690 [Streptosporangiaceae bacterium]